MDFNYKEHRLFLESRKVFLDDFVKNYKRPFYLYDLEGLRQRWHQMQKALPRGRIFYALKANHHSAVLKILKECGSGLDIVSGGELQRGIDNGFKPQNMIFSGVGKTIAEIQFALQSKIHQINVESLEELLRIAKIQKNLQNESPKYFTKPSPIVLRINPHISIKSHPYISTGLNENKFGIPEEDLPQAIEIFRSYEKQIQWVGLSLHIGSQILDLEPLKHGIRKTVDLFKSLKRTNVFLTRLDAGGGLGIDYHTRQFDLENQLLKTYAEIIHHETRDLSSDPQFELQFEPGRWIVGHSGVLITQVQYVKKTKFKNFVIVDTGMHHLLRPSLYQAHHQILPFTLREGDPLTCDVVGPICESSDFLAKNRSLSPVIEGDYLAILDTGAYGSVLSNTYNLQPPVDEVGF